MKKVICALLVCCCVLGSVSVFAADVMPRIDSDHQYGTTDKLVSTRTIDVCTKQYNYKVYCDECGRVVDEYADIVENHKFVNGECLKCGDSE